MPTTVKAMLAAANDVVGRISPSEAQDRVKRGEAVIVDVRDASEVAKSGKVPGAVNIPRGVLEFRADPAAASPDPHLSTDKTVILYCGGGSRAALAGKTLQELGYISVLNMGGFKDWVEAGLPVESVKD